MKYPKVNSHFISVTLTISFCLFFVSCGKTESIQEIPVETPKQEEPKPDPKPSLIAVVDLIKSKTTLVKSVTSSETNTLDEGITITNLKYINSADKNMSMHIIVADFSYKHVTAQVLNPFKTHEKKFQQLPAIVKANEEPNTKIWAAVNGDFFSWSNMETSGPFIYDGYVRKSNTPGSTRSAFGITRTGLPVFLNPPAGETSVFTYGDNLLRHLIGGREWLLYNGKKITITDNSVEPRTSIGMREDKKVISIVVDGREASHSNGMSLAQLQSVYEALGAKFAFNFDGGGSTVAVVRQNNAAEWDVVNQPSESPYRAIANALGFVSTK